MPRTGLSEFQTCAVTGATSPIGCQLVDKLVVAGKIVHSIGRVKASSEAGPMHVWHHCDLIQSGALPQFSAQVLFHVASIWLLPDWIEKFHENGVRRIIAFSSTSRLSKAGSSSSAERDVVESLAHAEDSVADICRRLGIAYTIFRPTLIYGAGRDRNVADIARFVKRFGVFPVLGKGSGLRQPVHAADLAQACILAAECDTSYNRIYNLSGGETLTYRQMVSRVFEAMGKHPQIISVPESLFTLVILIARMSSKYKHLKPQMAKRMEQDLCFDHFSAVRDFGYAPRAFLLDHEALGLR